MSIIDRLASSQGRRDEVLNQELAKEIVHARAKKTVQELVDNLSSKKAIQNDCIKVLYEIGENTPELIADYVDEFTTCLESKNNRLQWGAMTALSKIAPQSPNEIYAILPDILSAAERGSVITKDRAVDILLALCKTDHYAESAFALLIEQLLKGAVNQLPMYAEKAMTVVDESNKVTLINALISRLDDIEKESKRKRVEKVIKKLS